MIKRLLELDEQEVQDLIDALILQIRSGPTPCDSWQYRYAKLAEKLKGNL